MGKKFTISVRSLVAYTLLITIVVSTFYFAPVSEAGVETLNVTNYKKNIEVGKSFQIKLNGLAASKVNWSSSDKKIASVSKTGIVKGIKAGNVKISGKYKGITFVINVKVEGSKKSSSLVIYKKTKFSVIKSLMNDDFWEVQLKFTNNGSSPKQFRELYRTEVFQGGQEIPLDYIYDESVKDGATYNVRLGYVLVNNKDVEFSIINVVTGQVVFSKKYKIK